jgi:tetraacyldisaccharide 4'-kinase
VYSENQSLALNSINDFTLVTGIANANPLINHLNSKGLKFDHLNFKDHYNFATNDIDLFSKKSLILTTEKDYMRLMEHDVLKDKLFYLPIQTSIDREAVFNTLIKKFTLV